MLKWLCCGKNLTTNKIEDISQTNPLDNQLHKIAGSKGDMKQATEHKLDDTAEIADSIVSLAIRFGPPKSHLRNVDRKIVDQLNNDEDMKFAVLSKSEEWRKYFYDAQFNFNQREISEVDRAIDRIIDIKVFEQEICKKACELEKKYFKKYFEAINNPDGQGSHSIIMNSRSDFQRSQISNTESLYDYLTESKDKNCSKRKKPDTKTTNSEKMTSDTISIQAEDSDTI